MVICKKCSKIMKVEKIGIQIVEDTEKGTPYKVWMADKLKCPDCGYIVLFIDPKQKPISQRYKEGFDIKVYNSEGSFV